MSKLEIKHPLNYCIQGVSLYVITQVMFGITRIVIHEAQCSQMAYPYGSFLVAGSVPVVPYVLHVVVVVKSFKE